MTRLRAKATKSNKPFCFNEDLLTKDNKMIVNENLSGWVEIRDDFFLITILENDDKSEHKMTGNVKDMGHLHLAYFVCFSKLKEAENGKIEQNQENVA